MRTIEPRQLISEYGSHRIGLHRQCLIWFEESEIPGLVVCWQEGDGPTRKAQPTPGVESLTLLTVY
jgi:hypothetical protein